MTATTDRTRYYRSPEAAAGILDLYQSLLDEWPAAIARHTVSTRQGDTFVMESGDPDKPPVVLLHGSLANSASWLREVDTWSTHFHLFAVDMIGEPGLSAPVRPPLESEDYACWLDDVLDALDLPSAALVGVSLGGWLALDYVIRRPQRVSRLAVIVPGGVGPQRNILIWALPLMLLGPWGRKKVSERLLGPEPEITTATESRFGDMIKRIGRHCIPRYDHLPVFSDQALADIAVPVMAVVAGRDVILAPGPMRQRLEDHVPDLHLLYLPEARHYPGNQALPVLEFLQRPAAG